MATSDSTRKIDLKTRETEEALRAEVGRLQLLMELHETFRDARELSAIFQRVYDILPRHLGVHRASLLLYDAGRDALVSDQFLGVEHPGENLVSQPQPIAHSISGKCFGEAKPVMIPDCARTELIPPQIVAELRLKATLAVPVMAHGSVIGVLRVDDTERTRTFCEREVSFLSLVAEQLAIIIENARLLSQHRQSEADLRFLAEAGHTLASSLDYQATLTEVGRLALSYLADLCLVDLLDESGQIQRVAALHADPEKATILRELQLRYPPDRAAHNPSANVLRTGEPEVIADLTDEVLAEHTRDPEHARLVRELGIRSMLAVPLAARGRTLGSICLGASPAREGFSPRHVALAKELAGRAALAIDNALLYRAVHHADRAKEHFIAMLAHELRNPLSAVTSATYILKSEDASGEAKDRALKVLSRQVRHQARLVDDLLDVSRITRGKIDLRVQELDLAMVVREVADDCRGAFDEHGLALDVDLPPRPVWVEGDPTRLAQVFVNLLNNALKFTSRGGRVAISLEVQKAPPRGRAGSARQPATVLVRVKDNGIGIEPDMLTRVFDAFIQAGSLPAASPGGLGLGLSLVRGLIELHRGQVTAHSDGPGTGSEFTVRLPVTRTA